MHNHKRIVATAVIGAILALGLSACNDKANEPFQDAPLGSYNGQRMDVIEGADGFSNVGTKCDGHGGRVFMAYHGNTAYASVTDIPYGLLKPSDPCRNQG